MKQKFEEVLQELRRTLEHYEYGMRMLLLELEVRWYYFWKNWK